jgi:hypothetical protein
MRGALVGVAIEDIIALLVPFIPARAASLLSR